MKNNVFKWLMRILCVVFVALMVAGRVSTGTVEQAIEDERSLVYAESFLSNSIEAFDKRLEDAFTSARAEFDRLSRLSSAEDLDAASEKVMETLDLSAVVLYLEGERVASYGKGVGENETEQITELRQKNKDFVSAPFDMGDERVIALRLLLWDCGLSDEAIMYYTVESFSQMFFSVDEDEYDYRANNAYFCLAEINGSVVYSASEDGALDVGDNLYEFINAHIDPDSTRITRKMMLDRFVTAEKVPFVFSLGGSIYVSSFGYADYLGGNYVIASLTDYNLLSFGKGGWDIAFNVLAAIFFLLGAAVIVAVIVKAVSGKKEKEEVVCDDGDFRSLQSFEVDSVRLITAGKERYAVVNIGVDKFHLVREMFGDAVSEEAVRFLNGVIKKMLFPDETYAHLGKDKFVVMLRYRKHDEMITRLKMICDVTERYKPFFIDRKTLKLRIGVYPLEEVYDSSEAINNATVARKVHEDYPNVLCVFYSEAQEVLEHGLSVDPARKLKRAIENREFRIHFRPVYNLHAQKLERADVVVRRYDKEREQYIAPDEWEPEYRTPEFKAMLDFHVFREAMRFVHSVMEEGVLMPPLGISISDLTINTDKFPIAYTDLRKRLGVPSGSVTMRFSEAVVLNDPAKFRLISEKLKMGGINSAIRNFGKGGTACTALKKAPVTEISVGKRFIAPSSRTGPDFALLRTAMDAVKSYGIRVIQSGVSTKSALDLSISGGRYAVSGDYYCPVLTPYEYLEFIKGDTSVMRGEETGAPEIDE
ncbi:MAG: EAL domain-containing protein [Clostridia bacterium]|nr:EAL domain-containing protein [Clostridia bacterium]